MAQVICKDGTVEEAIVGESLVPNCFTHGGFLMTDSNATPPPATSGDATPPTPAPAKPKGLTTTQKWIAIIGITGILYYILHKAGSLK